MQHHASSIRSVQNDKQARRRRTVSTKDLINQPIYDINGEVIGHLAEIELEVERGMVAYVIIGCEGQRDCVLPFDLVQISTDPPKLRARIHRSVFWDRS